MKQSLCLFTIIAFVSFTSAQFDVKIENPTTVLAAKHVATNFPVPTEEANDIPILNDVSKKTTTKPTSTTVDPSTTVDNSTTVDPSTTEIPTTTVVPSTTKPIITTTPTPKTTTPSNNVTTTASPNPTPSPRSYDSFSFFGGLLIGIIIAVAGLFAFKFYKNRDPSYQNL